MKKLSYAIAALCALSAPVVANDRTEEGTAASRNAVDQIERSSNYFSDTAAFGSTEAGVPYVNPAGSDPYEVLHRRYSRGNGSADDFNSLKRMGIDFQGHDD